MWYIVNFPQMLILFHGFVGKSQPREKTVSHPPTPPPAKKKKKKKFFGGHSIFISCLEMAVFSGISECYINKSIDFSRQFWFCIFFSPSACWGQAESQPHCKSPGGMTLTSVPYTLAGGKASEILGCYFPMGGLKFVLLSKNYYIYLYT